ncbi:MAG: endonuclease [Actinomycetota bacterium]
MSKPRSVALVTLGCARNEVDSEELAGRLAADGWELVTDPGIADIALVNTCGFIESAKKDSIDALLEAHSQKSDGTLRVRKQMQFLALMITKISLEDCKEFYPVKKLRFISPEIDVPLFRFRRSLAKN